MRIFVKVKPASFSDKLVKIEENYFEISVKSKPEKGKANQAVVKVLAKYLKVPISSIKLISGASSRKKVFEV